MRSGRPGSSTRSSVTSTPCLSRDNSRASAQGGEGGGRASLAVTHHSSGSGPGSSFDSGYGIHSYVGKEGKRETAINDVHGAAVRKLAQQQQQAPLVTVINADSEVGQGKSTVGGASSGGGGGYLGPPGMPSGRAIITGAPSPRQLSRQGSSIESTTVHQHTMECAAGGARLHQPTAHAHRGSPTSNECDFHCCSLHGQSSHKTVATSPIQVRTFFYNRPVEIELV